MARIPEAEIQRLKDEVSVAHLAQSSGLELKKSGKDFTARCPFHADDTASLVITPEKKVLFYFGWRTTFPTESMVRPLLLAEDCPAGG